MDEKENYEPKVITEKQLEFLDKLMSSSKLFLNDYEEIRSLLKSKIKSSYDMSVLINYVLSKLKYKKHFFNGRNRARKICKYCKSRENILRCIGAEDRKFFWLCENCAHQMENDGIVASYSTKKNEIQNN